MEDTKILTNGKSKGISTIYDAYRDDHCEMALEESTSQLKNGGMTYNKVDSNSFHFKSTFEHKRDGTYYEEKIL